MVVEGFDCVGKMCSSRLLRSFKPNKKRSVGHIDTT